MREVMIVFLSLVFLVLLILIPRQSQTHRPIPAKIYFLDQSILKLAALLVFVCLLFLLYLNF